MPNENKAFNFEDHFSNHSEQYAQHRPQYPDEIYAYLASITPGHSLAWDCGTGIGQAAVGLAKYFDKVLVTVAVAIHWFNFDEFYREVKRVLKPNGILAAWTYSFPEISPEIDPLINQYYYEVLNGYWPERIHYLEERYETIPFPFEEITAPSFVMEINWNLIQLSGFLDSWSATQRYKAQKGHHPLEIIWPELSAAWGNENESRLICWPLHF